MNHVHGLLDNTVSFIPVYANKGLLGYHNKMQKWTVLGCHVEEGEDPIAALFRELFEEVGMHKKDVRIFQAVRNPIRSPENGRVILIPPTFMDTHIVNAPHTHRHLGMIYVLRAKTSKFVISPEHRELRWLNRLEITDPQYDIEPNVQSYVRAAIRLVGP